MAAKHASSVQCERDSPPRILLLEPFYGGSHRQLIDLLQENVPCTTLFTLPASKWHWRARTSALYFASEIPTNHSFKLLFASSVLNLAELVALRPDLACLRKVLYFHENQLVYPVRKQQDRDFQYGYNQIISCLVADTVVFNSSYNQESFLASIASFMKLMPDRPRGLADKIRPKCKVVSFPINFPDGESVERAAPSAPTSTSLPPQDDKREYVSVAARLGKSEIAVEQKKGGKVTSDPISIWLEAKTASPRGDHDGQTGQNEESEDNPPANTDRCSGRGTQNGNMDVSNKKSEVQEKESKSSCVCDVHGHEQDSMQRSQITVRSIGDSVGLRCSGGNDEDTGGGAGGSCHSDALKEGQCCGSRFSYCTQDEEKVVHSSDARPLHIVWPHRWEHDKNPEELFDILFQLHDAGCEFHVSVLGETYQEIPPVFAEARERISSHILHWGYLPSKQDYYNVLSVADVVISTAHHEFFGVAMLEAVYLGCYPMCPNRLVYPEIFPSQYIYRTPTQLLKKLKRFCSRPDLARNHLCEVELSKYSWKHLKRDYLQLFDNDQMPSSECNAATS
ncbi:tRNA-queuosine alpha-mannosyltransferase-like [Diadema setosum]|uniref:tRNA-queuosine alpha-mannosyltransferase-like n=1 Tax=Diadema setosum TaxID=31175 RepID=UPI003B3B3A9E